MRLTDSSDAPAILKVQLGELLEVVVTTMCEFGHALAINEFEVCT